MGKVQKYAISGLVGVVGLAILGAVLPKPPNTAQEGANPVAAQLSPDPRGVAMAKLLVLEDFKGYLVGNQHVGKWWGEQAIDATITARELYQTYSYNEVAADNQLKGKSIAVTGILDKISKDVFDNIYVMLEANGFLRQVQALLSDEAVAQAAVFEPGQKITLICKGAGMILTSPVLKDCKTVTNVVAAKEMRIGNLVEAALISQDGAPQEIRQMAGFGYVIGTMLPQGNACETATPDDMTGCGQAMAKLPKDNIKKRYDDMVAKYGFPERPNPTQPIKAP